MTWGPSHFHKYTNKFNVRKRGSRDVNKSRQQPSESGIEIESYLYRKIISAIQIGRDCQNDRFFGSFRFNPRASGTQSRRRLLNLSVTGSNAQCKRNTSKQSINFIRIISILPAAAHFWSEGERLRLGAGCRFQDLSVVLSEATALPLWLQTGVHYCLSALTHLLLIVVSKEQVRERHKQKPWKYCTFHPSHLTLLNDDRPTSRFEANRNTRYDRVLHKMKHLSSCVAYVPTFRHTSELHKERAVYYQLSST